MSRDKDKDITIYNNPYHGLIPTLFSNFFGESLFDGFSFGGFGGFKIDVSEPDDEYIIDADMPGIDKKNVVIDVNDHMLTISAQYDESEEVKHNDGRYIRRERRTGKLRRSFSLENIKPDEIRAEMNNGVLTIHCPKKDRNKGNSRRIPIN